MHHMNLSELPTICIHNTLLRECGHWTCRVEYQRLKNVQADRLREERREYEREYEREREREDARKRAEVSKTDKYRTYERPGKSNDGMRRSTSTNIQNLLVQLREFG